MSRIVLVLCIAVCFFARHSSAADSVKLFAVEGAAEAHCPGDVIVWFNTTTGTYYYYGKAQYQHTAHGAYACKKEADRAANSTTSQH